MGELPDPCPECQLSYGWYVPGNYELLFRPSGEANLVEEEGRVREGFEAECKNPECDATVFVRASADDAGEPYSTGSKELYEEYRERGPFPIKKMCVDCGSEFVTEAVASPNTEGKGFALYADSSCCSSSSLMSDKVGEFRGDGIHLSEEVRKVAGRWK